MTIRGLLEGIASPEEWTQQAACAEIGGDWWHPDKGQTAFYAKRICKVCPVSSECLAYALKHDERWGIWGGLTEHERQKLRKPRHAPQPKDMAPRPCEHCGTVFTPWRDTARFCSKRCNLDGINTQRQSNRRPA